MRRLPSGLLASLLLVTFMDEWLTFFPAGALDAIRLDLGLSYTQAGAVLAGLSLGGVLGTPLGGLAADFVDRRTLLAGGAFGYAAAMAVFGLSSEFGLLLVAAFAWGASSDAFIHPTEVVLVQLYPDEVETRIAQQNLGSAVGDILSPLTIAAVFALGFEWRVLFLGGGIIMVAYGVWFLTLEFPAVPAREDGHTPWSSLLSVARDIRVLRLALVLMLYATLDEPFVAFVILFLRDGGGYSEAVATLLAGGYIVGGLFGFLLVPWLTGRIAGRMLPLALTVVLALGVATLTYGFDPVSISVAALLAGVSGAAFYSIIQARALTIRPSQVGAVGTVVSYIDTAGMLVMPILVGAIADAAGPRAGLAVYVAIPLVILPLLLLGAADRPRPAPSPPSSDAATGSGADAPE